MESVQNQQMEVLHQGLAALKLRHWAKAMNQDLQQLKENERVLIIKCLTHWAASELADRSAESIKRKTVAAKFIETKTVDAYDFDYNKWTKLIRVPYMKMYNQIQSTIIPRAVFIGNTGLGKTHLAKALGFAVCQAGKSAFFTKASTIVNCLAAAKATHELEQELRKYRRPDLLIIDELGYVTMDLEASNLFFQVISDRHERSLGTVVTSNFPFGNWNQIFANDSVAVVIAERLTAQGEVFYLEGDSYPQTQKKKKKI